MRAPHSLVLFATAISALGQVRPEMHVVESVTLKTEQILRGEKNGTRTAIAGQLRIPPTLGRLPAVIFLHGSGGVAAREEAWARDLNNTGIAVFLLDSFASRGINNTIEDQAQLDHLAMMVDAYRALALLAKHPRIDPNRIAVMGWSKGAQGAIYSSFERFRTSYAAPNTQFAAHIGLFTPCNLTLKGEEKTTGKPLRLFHGTADDYTSPNVCRAFVERLNKAGVDIALTQFPSAHHSYDTIRANAEPVLLPNAVTTHNCLVVEGSGGLVLNQQTQMPFSYADACVERGAHVGYNSAATEGTKRAVIEFLATTFGLAR